MRTTAQIIAMLKKTRPNVAIKVEWDFDPYFPYFNWKGDGPDPAEDPDCPEVPHDVTVRAITIQDGVLVEGSASLGGSYSRKGGPHCPDIHGYGPQMIDRALENLTKTIERLPHENG